MHVGRWAKLQGSHKGLDAGEGAAGLGVLHFYANSHAQHIEHGRVVCILVGGRVGRGKLGSGLGCHWNWFSKAY